jgi:hypothetical protein
VNHGDERDGIRHVNVPSIQLFNQLCGGTFDRATSRAHQPGDTGEVGHFFVPFVSRPPPLPAQNQC